MNWKIWLFWGTIATLAQLAFEVGTQGLRLTRMSLPYMLGTMFTQNRSRAKLLGFAQHIVNGLLFTLVYVAAFHLIGKQTWWVGAMVGAAQATFVLLVVMTLLPEIHPRMASERYGPTAMKQLEPPGLLALNYGTKTPLSILISHVLFGTILGSFCSA